MTRAIRRGRPGRRLAATAIALAATGLATAPTAAPARDGGSIRVPAHKPGSGVELAYRIDGAPAVGVPIRIAIDVVGVADPAGAVVELSVEGGARLDGGARFTVPAGRGATLRATVTVPSGGLHFLNVFTTQAGRSSAVSIPIRVGAAAASAAPGEASTKATTTRGGERVVVLPAD